MNSKTKILDKASVIWFILSLSSMSITTVSATCSEDDLIQDIRNASKENYPYIKYINQTQEFHLGCNVISYAADQYNYAIVGPTTEVVLFSIIYCPENVSSLPLEEFAYELSETRNSTPTFEEFISLWGRDVYNRVVSNPSDISHEYIFKEGTYFVQGYYYVDNPYSGLLLPEFLPTVRDIIYVVIKDEFSTLNFDGETTDFASEPDLDRVGDAILERVGYGKIGFGNQDINFTGANLDLLVNISRGVIAVDSRELPQLNKSARLTFYNLSFLHQPVIFMDEESCPSTVCTGVDYTDGVFISDVTHFTVYSVIANSELTVWDDTDSQIKYVGDTIHFFANYTNSAKGEPIKGISTYCRIRFNSSGVWTTPVNMSFNSDTGLYQYKRSIDAPGAFDFDVSCDGTSLGYESRKDRNHLVIWGVRGSLSENTAVSFIGLDYSSIAWGDYDNDGDMDFALTGYYHFNDLTGTSFNHFLKLYKNNNGNLVEDLDQPVAGPTTGVEFGNIIWIDFDGDGDLDLVVNGMNNSRDRVLNIHENNEGILGETPVYSLEGTMDGDIAWGDYDSDGDLDLAICGNKGFQYNKEGVGKIYENNGGILIEDNLQDIAPVEYCSLAWADYDNDGDLDLALCGDILPDIAGGLAAKIYRNNDGILVEDTNQSLTPVGECSLAWGNYDNDGDLDLAICGCSHEHGSLRPACDEKVTKIYENVDGILVEDASQDIIGISLGSLAWGDYDNDGDLDLALSGKPLSTGSVSKIYNNIDTYLLEDIEQSLHPLQYSSLIWVDYDNDGDLDLTLNGVGWDGISGNPTKIYVNDQSLSHINNPPNPLSDINSSREVTLTEVLDLINRWVSGGPSATLLAVVELITAWVDNW